ncbi:hypothetical protein D7I43_03350 [Micromonospora globbae]|uniref:Uncharacterized protein n=1 Tax=Micromonospora globbae TaxID=1894969 RepID=A0A420F785_9ACTN|nr:hypothetical protein D7I43_03350 [Micromonospora globbae]
MRHPARHLGVIPAPATTAAGGRVRADVHRASETARRPLPAAPPVVAGAGAGVSGATRSRDLRP